MLEEDPKNGKALYRRAQAHLMEGFPLGVARRQSQPVHDMLFPFFFHLAAAANFEMARRDLRQGMELASDASAFEAELVCPPFFFLFLLLSLLPLQVLTPNAEAGGRNRAQGQGQGGQCAAEHDGGRLGRRRRHFVLFVNGRRRGGCGADRGPR